MTVRPEISIVMAAYGRPEVIIWSIRSVLAQTRTDWELIVVSDACSITCAAIENDPVISADERIKLFRLTRNVGEQSGPNNYGLARAGGRYIALLNQDDLWFSDHLACCVESLESFGADMVFSLVGAMVPTSRAELEAGAWNGDLQGLPKQGGYDPTTFSPASSWLMTRKLLTTVGPWRSAAECLNAPSQDFLYRAWWSGARIRSCPELTVLMFYSGGRKDSYCQDTSHEQRWWLETVGLTDSVRPELLQRLGYQVPCQGKFMQSISRAVSHQLLRGFAAIGVDPQALSYGLKNRMRKGRYLDSLRNIRGLPPLYASGRFTRQVQRAAIQRNCTYRLGEKVDFSRIGNSARHQLEGWSFPESWGTWTENGRAYLLFRFDQQPKNDVTLILRARTFTLPRVPVQRVKILINGAVHSVRDWTENDFTEITVGIAASMLDVASDLLIEFEMPDSRAPADDTVVPDRRMLGLGLQSLWIKDIYQAHAGPIT